MEPISEKEERLLGHVVAEWNQAEYAIKLAEISAEHIAIPSITELRYAGRHIVDYLAFKNVNSELTPDLGIPEELLLRVVDHAVRAKHDAVDAILEHAYRLISRRIEDSELFSEEEIRSDVDFIRSVRQKIAVSRSDRTSRRSIYEDIVASDLEGIVTLIDKYNLAPRASKKKSTAKSIQAVQFPATIAAIGGLVSAILGLIFALF